MKLNMIKLLTLFKNINYFLYKILHTFFYTTLLNVLKRHDKFSLAIFFVIAERVILLVQLPVRKLLADSLRTRFQ